MCILGFAIKEHPGFPFIFVANRDEFYHRKTAAAQFWRKYPSILAGVDLEKGGTWLGITKEGKFAALTNVREQSKESKDVSSRGELVSNYLQGTRGFHESILNKEGYGGYNLLYGDIKDLTFVSNRSNETFLLKEGLHAISNSPTLNSNWPKVNKLREGIKKSLSIKNQVDLEEELMEELQNETVFNDNSFSEVERMLSPVFIKSNEYGTRTSNVIIVDNENNCTFLERTHVPSVTDRRYTFKINNN
ncbi:NRDE family protein [Evansella tamaricis]|uniref:NRDE family protein n=1 Tax=Evansella tamaricis TaxID=2069301 RepID=A0ABS6JG56_9BACI|nr:NRDE family protein [Evansella tamaricis]MBU9711323.1 NRDE family protein [Evansella tamaricis]